MTHWAKKYIGLPYVEGGRGGAGVDCWGLLQLVYRNEFNIELPDYPGISISPLREIVGVIAEETRQDWIPVETPLDGCGIALSQQTVVHHVGIWADVDGGRIIHAWDKQNVVAETVRSLRAKGLRILTFYRHQLWKQHWD